MSVGMQSHMEMFQKAKRLCDSTVASKYVECKTVEAFANSIEEVYRLDQSRKGIFIFVVSQN